MDAEEKDDERLFTALDVGIGVAVAVEVSVLECVGVPV